MKAPSPALELDKPFSQRGTQSKCRSSFLLHLRFLRPLRSLIVVSACTLIAKTLIKQDTNHNAIASLVALAVALPLALGLFIAGAAHEPMHRPFALLLPAIRKRQRKFAVISVLVASVATTLMTIWATAAFVPPMATAGLACALTALPCLRQNGPGGRVASIGTYTLLICLWFGASIGTELALLMNAVPWLFLLGGLIIGVVSILRGFSRESARVRAHTLFLSPQTVLFSYAFRSGMRTENQAVPLIPHKKPPLGSRQNSRWTVRLVGSAPLDWMQVLWHANFGARMRGSFLRIHLRFSVVIAIYGFTMTGIMYLFDDSKGYWDYLAQLASPHRASDGILAMLLQPCSAMIIILGLVTPTIIYPISRYRMARVIFWHSALLSTLALTIPLAVIFFISVIGQIFSGIFLPGYGLPSLLAVDLLLTIFLPLILVLGTIQTPFLRIVAAVPVIGMLMLMSGFRSHWSNHVLTLPGCVLMLTLAAITQWLFWHRLQHEYATADLTRQTALITPQLPNLYP